MRPRSTSGTVLQEGQAGTDVAVEVPAPAVRVALAAAFAATVEEEDAVAVADEHARLPAGTGPAREDEHGRAVARGDIPARELQPVARAQRDLRVRGAEPGGRHAGPRDVRADVGGRERHRHDRGDDEDADRLERPPPVAPGRAVVLPARGPQRPAAQAEQERRGGQGEEPGPVVPRQPGLPGVVEGLRAAQDGREDEQQGERPARPGAHPRERPGREAEEPERHERADGMVGGGRAGLGVDDAVVQHVGGQQGGREPEQRGRPAQGDGGGDARGSHAATLPVRPRPAIGGSP